jgi:hypothetical protein
LLFCRNRKDKYMKKDTRSSALLEKKKSHLLRGEKRIQCGQGLKPDQSLPSGFTHIKAVIDGIFNAPTFPVDLDDVRIWKLWESVVGKKIAEHAQPSMMKRGVLLVKVSDSVWLQELEFKTEKIKERLNRRLHREAIKKIRLKVGEPQRRDID